MTTVAPERNFQFFTPVSFFEKANAPEGFRRRIGGLVTTEARDQEGETILQRGLDFDYFLNRGWYNDNHSKAQTGVLGYPDFVKYVQKGAKLPDGTVAPNAGHWAEGYLLEGWEPADKIWRLGQALKKTMGRRRLGFSVEGGIQKRAGPDNKTIAKARIKNVAITHCPVNPETGLAILEKSLIAAETNPNFESETIERALTAGAGSTSAPDGPRTGEGAGTILTPESLEHDGRGKKKLTKAEAVDWFLARFPHADVATAGRFVDTTLRLAHSGLI